MKKDNKVYIGSWLTCPDQGVVEVMAKSGYFDWLAVGMEHFPITIHQAEQMIRITQLAGLQAYVRLSSNNTVLIKRVLDVGADGIIVPMVNSADDVKHAVDACFYPPRGNRGVGLGRAQNYGTKFDYYRFEKEPNTKIIIQVEHINAVRDIDRIFSQKGIWGYFIGPYDLSASLGKPGDFDCKEVVDALKIITEAGIQYKLRAGYHVIEPDFQQVRKIEQQGFQIIAVSLDMLFLQRGIDLAFKST